MSNSKLVDYTYLSPNYNTRTDKIRKITIHHTAGRISVEGIGSVFQSRQASSNYGIDSDGRVGMYVEEKNRSWASSSPSNDHQAVTIEVSNSESGGDWPVSDKALSKLIDLCVDICERNGIEKLNYTGDTSGNLTMHKWFAATACPGPYLESRFPWIAEQVNKRLNPVEEKPVVKPSTSTTSNGKYPAVPFTVNVIIDDLNYRATPSLLGKVNGQTGKGVFTIVEVKNGWGKLKSGAGWIYLENKNYCTIGASIKAPEPAKPAFNPYLIKVTADVLNVRTGAGTGYDITTQITENGVYTIVDEANGAGATKWGLLKAYAKDRNGWISLDYVKKV